MMSFGGHFRLVFAVVGITVVSILYYMKNEEMEGLRFYDILQARPLINRETNEVGLQPGYLVWSPRCKILDINPWDETIRSYLNPAKPVVCSSIPLLTYTERRKGVGNVLRIDKGTINKYKLHNNHHIECCFSIISRVSQSVTKYNSDADNKFKVSECTPFKKEAVLSNTTEFALVKCHSAKKNQKSGKEVYKNVHAVVPILPQVSERLKESDATKPQNTTERLNVLIFGIDSVSRLNLRRTMPNTLSYLQKNKWVELNGYNKIADNTFPNLMAILSGQNMTQIGSQCYVNKTKKMDDCPNIWKDYKEHGYVTAYAEDAPHIGTFNFLQTGFVQQPTDYYLRPFMLASHELLSKKNQDGLPVCVGPVAPVDHVFDYAKNFIATFGSHNYFGLFWLNSLSHNDVNSPAALDFRLNNFLKDLTDLGAYENSVVILLSDHGMRFGWIRKTFVGYYEERLPFIFIWFPKRFREKHPKEYNNLLVNQNRLTTPYDVYVTLQQLLQPEAGVKSKGCPKCPGLLENIAWNRGCDDAEVELHWCMCPDFREMHVDDPIATRVGAFLFDKIKNRTRELLAKEKIQESFCAEWSSWTVVRAQQSISQDSEANGNLTRGSGFMSGIFVIIIETKPGAAMFEATIRVRDGHDGPVMEILDFISRLDSYLNTSKCVNSRLLKFYCHCL